MNLSALTVHRLVRELEPRVARRLIREVFLVGRHDLYLALGEAGHLLLSAQPGRSRVVFSTPPEDAPKTRLPWADRFLLKAGILRMIHVPHERIVEFTITKRDRLGTSTDTRIICELIGRYANVIAADAETGSILGALRQVGARQNRVRTILPGHPYQPPPTFDRLPPANVTAKALKASCQNRSLDDALVQTVAGLDPLTAREIIYRTGISAPETPADFEKLASETRQFLTNPPFVQGATIATDTGGKQTLTVLDLQHAPLDKTFPSIVEAIEAFLASEGERNDLRGHVKIVERELHQQREALARKIERMQTDLDDAAHADAYEKWGNVLMVHLDRVPPGSDTVRLPDVFAEAETEIEIPLNARRTPTDNARDYLKRSRKARKGAPILERRLRTAHEKARQLEDYLQRLAAIRTERELEALRSDLVEQGVIKQKRQKQSAKKQKRAPGDVHPRRYRTTDGQLVLVGRNNKENDRLTRGSARDDLFFHAHGCPGSHVILKREGRPDNPSRATLKETAALAAYWSKARGAKKVSVNYTEVRYVQKPRGAPPGLVTICNEKTLMVEPREIQRDVETD